MTKKQNNADTGRPKHYNEEMLRSVISEMLGNGISAANINEKCVKPILCEKHGVSETINSGSLTKHVTTVLEAVVAEQNEALLVELPSHVAPALDDLIAELKQDMLLMVARQNDICQREAGRECKILRQDKANANWRIAELEGDAGRLEEQVAELQMAQTELEAELATARATVTALESELEQRGSETRTVGMLIAEVRGDPAARKELQEFFSQIVADRGEQPRSA
jgi:hypothetical protein